MKPFVPVRGTLIRTPDPQAIVGAQVIHIVHGGNLVNEYTLRSELVMRFGEDFPNVPEYVSVAGHHYRLRDYNEAMALITEEGAEHIMPFLDNRIKYIEAELDKWLARIVREGAVHVNDEEIYTFESIDCFQVDGLLTYIRSHGVQG